MWVEKNKRHLVALLIVVVLIFGIVRALRTETSVHPEASKPSDQILLESTWLSEPKRLPEGRFVTDQGEGVTQDWFKGQWHLVFLGYTHCPDVCPVTLALAKQVLALLGPQEPLRFTFISADPTRDRPAVLRSFLDRYDPKFQGLTGEAQEIFPWLKSLGLYALEDEQGLTHSGAFLLINPQGAWVALFAHPQDPAAIAHDIQVVQGKRKALRGR